MKAGRRSSIEQLPEPLQEEVNRLVRAGWKIDDIVEQLRSLGATVSRSAMGRYAKSARESMQVYREAQEVAKVWIEKLESEPQGDVARLLPEMLRALSFNVLSQMGQGGDTAEPVKPMDVMLLAKAIKDLSATSKDAFAIDKARAEAREQGRKALLAEQQAKLDAAVKEKGVTQATRAEIRSLLGIQ